MRLRSRILVALFAFALAAGCEDVTHENIDKWQGTTKGPGKLVDALRGDHAADLRAHAAQKLVAIDRFDQVRQLLEDEPPASREKIMEHLAGRLQQDAQVADRRAVPSPRQLAAKDALFELRDLADGKTREAIDAYLIEWLATYYEGRAKMGRAEGTDVVRRAGAKAAPKLLAAARTIVATPPDAEGRVLMLGDELLKGLAYTGSPDAVGFLLDLAGARHVDSSLPGRAIGALNLAYVEDVDKPAVDKRALAPHVDRLAKLLGPDKAEDISDNAVFDLIAAAGPPECVAPLVKVVADPTLDEAYLWTAAQKALRCGQADAVVPVVEALPTDRPYQRAILEKYLWDKMTDASYGLSPGKAAVAARTLLASASWVARVTGVEVLGKAGNAGDAAKLRELAGDKTVLKGWWGDQRDVDPGKRRPEPTLGMRAQEVAEQLAKR